MAALTKRQRRHGRRTPALLRVRQTERIVLRARREFELHRHALASAINWSLPYGMIPIPIAFADGVRRPCRRCLFVRAAMPPALRRYSEYGKQNGSSSEHDANSNCTVACTIPYSWASISFTVASIDDVERSGTSPTIR